MSEIYKLHVQTFGERFVFACCNHENKDLCTVPHNYLTGRTKPNYPVPAIPLELEYLHDTFECECVAVTMFEMNSVPKCVLFVS